MKKVLSGLLLYVLCLGCQSTALSSAKLYLQQNEPQKAEEQLHQALQTEAQNPEAHFLLGRLYADQGKYQEMDQAFDRSLELSQKFAPQIQELRQHYWTTVYNEGVRQAAAQPPDFPGALGAFQRATLIEPARLESWRNLAFVYYQLDSLDATVKTYQQVLAIVPSDTSTLYSIGVLCLKLGRSQEAAQALAEYLKLKPAHVEGLVNLAVAQLGLQDSTAAEATYLQAVSADPKDHRPHYNLGNLYFTQKKYPMALAAYQRAVDLAPADQDARYNLAVVYLALEQVDRAFPLLQELAGQDPGNAAVWRELGRIHAIKGRVVESEKAYARADSLGR
ncbi:MAG: tetratricopeptide repeat protein [Candidatus Latescibacteria bacterium]|nr:tetratricopeptide repeat protein [Candidatus Latescibacterota bacterium]